ncbi:1-aminocyclopropane-1-carboxylate deaminase/D-cysteine desulfhydrase [Dyadobacter sp. NIV53]|uniref:1-aminocyclopropane-1-carboxylate deaminase/D-cysteine desulfhydrase n=1 Tax=Dyadobacter sp. NIV53 TaxID=2861765 RepID=UPI001C889F5E|nr:pyridoxal-phosphate dependent enzyme [Dyadobacter sp. NIV53]
MDLLIPSLPTPLQELTDEAIKSAGVRLFIKRDDLIHPTVSGNKWRKLKYNLQHAISENAAALLTFGGAYSNHLYAMAAAGNALRLNTIGIVRGEDYAGKITPTLQFCQEQNMMLHFVSRQEYRQRNDPEYLQELSIKFNNPYLIPEGGTTNMALKGVQEMTREVNETLGRKPDYYAVAAGTGGTAAGILSAGNDVLVFSALKGGGFLEQEIKNLLPKNNTAGRMTLFSNYHFGGYGKWTQELLDFILDFKLTHSIQLEQVYTAKMFYGLYNLMKQDFFEPGTVIVAVHTGGLQGLLQEFRS